MDKSLRGAKKERAIKREGNLATPLIRLLPLQALLKIKSKAVLERKQILKTNKRSLSLLEVLLWFIPLRIEVSLLRLLNTKKRAKKFTAIETSTLMMTTTISKRRRTISFVAL